MDKVVEGSMYRCWNSSAYFNTISMLESSSTDGWVASEMKHQRLGGLHQWLWVADSMSSGVLLA